MTYQLTHGNCILRLEDRAWIPFDPGNIDYQAYLAWIDEGNTPLPPEGSVRARNEDGTFVGDDPATPTVNEAWVDGSPQ